MVSTTTVARILGVHRPLPSSPMALRRLIENGLPKAALGHVVSYVVANPSDAATVRDHLIAPATYKRRTRKLKADESERIERLARVMALAEDAFGSADDARAFLASPHPELDGERPLDAARTELGARQIEEILWRMEYGLPA